MQGVHLNGHRELAPDVKASSWEESTRNESTSGEGVDVILENVDSIFYQFKGDSQSQVWSLGRRVGGEGGAGGCGGGRGEPMGGMTLDA